MDVTVYYVEMFANPRKVVPPPREGLEFVALPHPTVRYYRYLYDAVGRDYNWRRRKAWSDEQLAAEIQDPKVEIVVLMVEGVPAGFGQLDYRQPGEVELVQFGIMEEYFGQGLGKYFVNETINHVWKHDVKRFWLHTCTRDHKYALENYLKAGFTLYKEEVEHQSA